MFALEHLAELRRHIDAFEAEWPALVAEYDRSGEWHSGFLTAAAAIGHACRINRGHASAHVSLARKLSALPEMKRAFSGGEISRAHVQVIADAYTPERTDALEPLEPQFVDAARDTSRAPVPGDQFPGRPSIGSCATVTSLELSWPATPKSSMWDAPPAR
jgi:hypothetical protein